MSGSKTYHVGEQWRRSRMCGELGISDKGDQVTLAGWVKKVREFGELTFMDLWDRTGLVQVVVESSTPDLHELIRSLRAEDVVAVTGTVRPRPDD
ncbi:MAG TPA: OB-fold nucleic acid binding domain-containing protein, partial [Candidatus Krumholzibacterium sp.]|nr:OB-fold nucleic acid binding domain-containing protein [Candidatus Krumholzibacterium sp.]